LIKPGIYPNLDNHDYHHNPDCKALSKGGIVKLMKSPAHFKVKVDHDYTTPALNFGSAFHACALDSDMVMIEPQVDRRTKEGKAIKSEFDDKSIGEIVVNIDEYTAIEHMCIAIENHSKASVILSHQELIENSVFWNDPDYNFLCKCRPDIIIPDLKALVDLKSCLDASPEKFSKDCANYGYHIQASWYLRGINEAQDDIMYDKFLFVCVEKTPPYGVMVYSPDEMFYEAGNIKIQQALETYDKCLTNNEWPCYDEKVTTLSLPYWSTKEVV